MPSNNGYQQLNSHGPFYSQPHQHPQQQQPSPPNSNNILRPYSVEELCAGGSPPPPLQLADKVVWLSDSGPEYGVVKWLGKLPDVGHEWMAGVDFVNPVGSGTGLYNEFKLFETKMNHASLVPIVGLMKAADYIGANCNNEDLLPPQKPRRTKKLSDSYKFYTEKDLPNQNLSSDTKSNNPLFANVSLSKVSSNLNNLSLNLTNNSFDTVDNEKPVEFEPITINLIKHKNTNDNSSVISPIKSPVLYKQNSLTSPSSSNQNGLLSPRTINNKIVYTHDEPTNLTKSNELFELGSVVEVTISSSAYYGVIRWLGFVKNDIDYSIDSIQKVDKNFKNVIAGIELEEEISGLSDGTLNGRRYFTCHPNKAYFVNLSDCTRDRRFCSSLSQSSDSASENNRRNSTLFGSIDCPTVLGDVSPLKSCDDLDRLCGKNRGIQGHHNSCYLDATLFAMFSCSTIFESLLYRPKRKDDIPEYNEVQRILKEEIVNPLRANLYVRADRVMHLRQLLERISSVRGLTSEEKDPEEFLNLLLNEILKTDPYLKLSSGLESFFYQLFVEKDENLQIPNVQQLFDQSFLASDIKLREIPPCLLIQMPRFGREFKMYSRIIPSLYLDVTNVLENSPRQCVVCGGLAEYECKECFGKLAEGLESIAFCTKCLDTSHNHKKRSKHKAVKLTIPSEFAMLKDHTNIPRVVMELFAVLCIETSHYVSFVKCGSAPDSPWCFFDSMADRKGEQNGYNIPEVVSFTDLKWWLSQDGYNYLLNNKDDKLIPELPRRLLSDAYICFYSSEVYRYR